MTHTPLIKQHSAQLADYQFTEEGWAYYAGQNREGDRYRNIHFLVNEDTGDVKDLDSTFATKFSSIAIMNFIFLGFPRKQDGWGWTDHSLEVAFRREVMLRLANLEHVASGRAA